MSAANKSCYAMKEVFSWKSLWRRTKEWLRITYLGPISRVRVRNMIKHKGDEGPLAVFERKILRRIHGPINNVDTGMPERRKNNRLRKLYNEPNIRRFLNTKILVWDEHVWSAEGSLMKKVFIEKPSGKRRLGKPRQRWMYMVNKDVSSIDTTYNIILVSNRNRWRGIADSTKDLNRLFYTWEEEHVDIVWMCW